MRWFEWSNKSRERRRAPRIPIDSLAAVYWDGSANCSQAVRDVSLGGALIETELNWAAGTLIRMSLRCSGTRPGEFRRNAESTQHRESIREADIFVDVWSRVVRRTAHGLSVQFIFKDRAEAQQFRQFLESKVGEYVKESHKLTAAASWQRTGAH